MFIARNFVLLMADKTQILHQTLQLYMRLGIKSVTMDDVAGELGISKKTLYQVVENKRDLINQSIAKHITNEKEIMAGIRHSSNDAIDEWLRIARHVTHTLRNLNPSTAYDLKKYYRGSWNLMESLHNEYLYKIVVENIVWGKEKGLYRKDMSEDIIAKFHMAASMHIVDPDIFPIRDYAREGLFNEYFAYHMRGMVSQKGLALLEKYTQKK